MARRKRQSLGPRVRKLRESRGMGLEALVSEAGRAADYLRQIEADEIIPPVAVLLAISCALEVDSGGLFKDEEGQAMALERGADAVRKRTDQYSYCVFAPEARHKHLKGFDVGIEAGSDLEGPGYQHEGEEFVYVLKEQMRIRVGDNINDLEAGESLHFKHWPWCIS